jgi:hypothetical protein
MESPVQVSRAFSISGVAALISHTKTQSHEEQASISSWQCAFVCQFDCWISRKLLSTFMLPQFGGSS